MGIGSLTCQKCMKIFSCRQSKSIHIKNNKCKPISIVNSQDYKSSNNITNITNIIHNQINIHNQIINNIYINNYGDERIDYFTDDDMKSFIKQGSCGIVLYIEKKHFNNDFPENKNIFYTLNNRTLVKENNEWKVNDLQTVSMKLFEDNKKRLVKIINEDIDSIDKYIKNEMIFEKVKETFLLPQVTKSDLLEYKSTLQKIKKMIINTCKNEDNTEQK